MTKLYFEAKQEEYNLGNGDYITHKELAQDFMLYLEIAVERTSDEFEAIREANETIEEDIGIEEASELVWDDYKNKIESILEGKEKEDDNIYCPYQERGLNEYRDFL